MSYAFPQQTPAQLAKNLRLMNISLSEEAIKMPTPEIVMSVYKKFIETISGCPIELPDSEIVRANPDYREAFTQVMISKKMANICKHAGIGGFDCMKDFQIPTSKRFVYVLSGLVNFSKFKLVSVKDKIDNSQKLTDELITTYEETKESLENAKERLTSLKIKKEDLSPKIIELEKQHNERRDYLIELTKEADKLKTESEKLKETVQKALAELENTKKKLDETKEAAKKLRSQIVENPDQVKEKKQKLIEEEAEGKKSIADARQRQEATQNHLDLIEKLKKEIDRCLESLKNVNSLMASCKEEKREIDAARADVAKMEAEIKVEEDNAKHFRTCQINVQESSMKTAKEMDEQKQEFEKRIEEERAAKTEQAAENAELESIARMHLDRAEQIRKQMDEEQRKHNDEVNELFKKWSVFTESVKEYHNALQAATKEISFQL